MTISAVPVEDTDVLDLDPPYRCLACGDPFDRVSNASLCDDCDIDWLRADDEGRRRDDR